MLVGRMEIQLAQYIHQTLVPILDHNLHIVTEVLNSSLDYKE
jgi:hypothetical protein